MPIKYVEGDLFVHMAADASGKDILLPHVCNDVGAWGAGFVVPLGKIFPQARDRYFAWHRSGGEGEGKLFNPFGLGRTQFVRVQETPGVTVCNMVAQKGIGGVRPLRYNCLAACMDEVGCHSRSDQTAIHAPMFGSQLAGGQWEFIEGLIQDCWLERGFQVTIYYLPGKTPVGWTPPS